MLTLNTLQVTNRRGIKHSYTFLSEKGFSKHKIRLFHSGKSNSIRLKDLEHLCEIFNCTPNDLFEWQPNSNSSLPENHALNKLVKKPEINLAAITQDMNNDEIEEFSKRISEIKEELKQNT